ncbi:MAG: PEGA domain-containing protein [Pseudomonadota bacterium]|nr:PEGA domain-containing protein [Pseudomonadota bacterium]
MDEFVTVTFPGRRQVYVDGNPCGFTNDVIQVQTGTHTFDLGVLRNYQPSSQTVRVTGTLAPLPMIIAFQPRGLK